MREEKAIRQQGNNVLIRAKVKANSDQFEVGEINRWRNRLRISVNSAAKRGQANQELINKLEAKLGQKVTIEAGHKSNKKLLQVKNSSREEVKDRLLA